MFFFWYILKEFEAKNLALNHKNRIDYYVQISITEYRESVYPLHLAEVMYTHGRSALTEVYVYLYEALLKSTVAFLYI